DKSATPPRVHVDLGAARGIRRARDAGDSRLGRNGGRHRTRADAHQFSDRATHAPARERLERYARSAAGSSCFNARGRTVTKTKPRTPRHAGAPNLHPSFARVVKAFAGDPAVTCGKMFASTGLKVRGKIFAMHVNGKFVAKLPRDRVDELVRHRKDVTHFDPGHGRLMTEWVSVAGDEKSWVSLAREARRFVAASGT